MVVCFCLLVYCSKQYCSNLDYFYIDFEISFVDSGLLDSLDNEEIFVNL